MDWPVPDRGTDDEGNGKVNEGLGTDVTGLAPVEARVGYEDAYGADERDQYPQHGDPMRGADDQEATRRLSGLTQQYAGAGLVTQSYLRRSSDACGKCYLIAYSLAL